MMFLALANNILNPFQLARPALRSAFAADYNPTERAVFSRDTIQTEVNRTQQWFGRQPALASATKCIAEE